MPKPVSANQLHSLVRDRFPRLTSLERRRSVRGKASADGRQLAKATRHHEVMEKPAVKPVEVMQSGQHSSDFPIISRKSLRNEQSSGRFIATRGRQMLRHNRFQQLQRCNPEQFVCQSSDSETEVDYESRPKQKQASQEVRHDISRRRFIDNDNRKASNLKKVQQSNYRDFSRESNRLSELDKKSRPCGERFYPGRWVSQRAYSSDSSRERGSERCDPCSPRRYSPSPDKWKNQKDKRRKSESNMKPEKYNGTTCFETFLVQFNNCSEFNQWNEREKLHYLRWSLTGAAAQMLWGTKRMSFRELVGRLRSRFGSLDMEEKYQTEVQCRRRRSEETLRELAQDIRRLMMLAYPGDRSAMAERLAKEYFICALDDPELELKVREKEPQTLDSALKAAQRLEVFRSAVRHKLIARQRLNRHVAESGESLSDSLEEWVAKIEQNMCKSQQQSNKLLIQSKEQPLQQSKSSNKDKKKNDRRLACATIVSEDESWKEMLMKKVHDLEAAQRAAEANTKKITAENDALNKEVGRLRHLEQVRYMPKPATFPVTQENGSQPKANVKKCFNCGETGHYVRVCPHPRVPHPNARMPLNADNSPTLQVNGASGSSRVSHNSYLRAKI